MSGLRGVPPFRSDVEGIAWPSLQKGPGATLAAMMAELDRTQWTSAEEIARRQFQQFVLVAEHCARHSKQFAERLDRAGLRAPDLADWAGLSRLPVLTRREVQRAGADLYCREIPPGHLPLSEIKTSGSTGEPVTVQRTAVNAIFWSAMAMREHFWNGRDFTKGLCAIRANVEEPARRERWGAPVSVLYETGPSLVLPINRPAAQLVQWVAEFAPDNLLIYPSTLDVFASHCRQNGIAMPGLHHIRTIGETLSPRIRKEAEAVFGAKVEDLYSSNEIGYIAVQCPESGLYHVMAEDVIVEILNETGAPCAAGETGRVTVTSLHNFAMPLIRYDIGDYAEAGAPCACGRGLPTLARIAGRERNLILMPDGSRFWPVGGLIDARDIAPLSQWQMIQTAREAIEIRLIVERPLTADEEEKLRALVVSKLGYPFALDLKYFEGRLPLGPNGKFEEFVCRVG